jgi:hypothetical protein
LFRRGGSEFMLTRCVDFWVELLKTTLVKRSEKTGNYHNPKRQSVSEGFSETLAKPQITIPH